MAYSIQKVPGEPIIINRWEADFDDKLELPQVVGQLQEILDEATEPMHLISDRRVYTPSVDAARRGAGAAGRGRNPLFHHPNIGKIVFVSSSEMVRLIAEGMSSNTYGSIRIKVVETMDEALAYVRAS